MIEFQENTCTDERTERRTDGRIKGQTEGRTDPISLDPSS